jgi:lysophospholipase L1-like esterase/poly(3-hydroxybutyrate) depolymerase
MTKTMKCLLSITAFLVIMHVQAQNRYKSDVFSQIDSSLNITYGEAMNIKGEKETLLLDVFSPPKDDVLKLRPLVIFIHGGGFQNNSKTGKYSSMLCASFAKKGYVCASIDYRLGVEKSGFDSGKKVRSNNDYAEAMYRAQQDGKAAVRFFRRYADKYGVDSSQIFITGSSAGSKTCLAMAYLSQNEIPGGIDVAKWGSLEGSSGNEGYSSKVSGVMNAWGAMIDYKWIQKGDAPLFNTAGTKDKTVPYDSSFDYHGFKYGPYILFQHCLLVGVPTGWRPFINAGHTLDNNSSKQDSCINSMVAWLYTQLKTSKGKSEAGVWRWEKEMASFDSLNAVEKYNSKAIMFLGSSYIRLWKNIRTDLQYKDIIHRGFGGCNLVDVAYYVKRIVYPHNPKALFIYVGNDIVVSEKDKAPDQILELYKYVVQVVRQKYQKMPITFLAISPSEKRWASWDKVQEANALVKAYCASAPSLYFIDAGQSFLGEDGKPITSLYRDDKLHYNEEGYKVWGAAITKEVKRISKK